MTATLTVVCDKCGCEIVTNRVALDVRSGPLRARRETIDLCEPCCKCLDEWLRSGRPDAGATAARSA